MHDYIRVWMYKLYYRVTIKREKQREGGGLGGWNPMNVNDWKSEKKKIMYEINRINKMCVEVEEWGKPKLMDTTHIFPIDKL